ncbi:MAG: hypothetical protein QOG72_2783 [Sphingomonadales bacterium]|jgi:hypothetical protein|nr:hypothetical protein [Sphingomonadales bacterium]
MPATTTLPVLAGLSILGAALGVNLGRSAVAEINPAYYQEPEEHFHADLVPYRSPDWAQAQAAGYQAAQQPVVIGDLGSGCIGCRDYPVEYYPKHDPAVDGYQDGYAASAPQPAQVVIVETPAPDPAREQVQRYASYQVSSDEKPAQIAEAPAEPTAEPTGL